jgi:hypothetical protein
MFRISESLVQPPILSSSLATYFVHYPKFFNKIIRNEKILKNTLRGRCTWFSSVITPENHPRTTQYIWLAPAVARPIFASVTLRQTSDILKRCPVYFMPSHFQKRKNPKHLSGSSLYNCQESYLFDQVGAFLAFFKPGFFLSLIRASLTSIP